MLEFFAEAFSRYWFVFILAVIVTRATGRGRQSRRRVLVGRTVTVAAAAFIVLGLIGMVVG